MVLLEGKMLLGGTTGAVLLLVEELDGFVVRYLCSPVRGTVSLPAPCLLVLEKLQRCRYEQARFSGSRLVLLAI